MKKYIMCGLLIAVTLAFCLYVTPSATAASAEEEVLQVMTDWIKAYNIMDLDLMSSLYSHSPKTSSFGPRIGYPFLFQGWEVIGKSWESDFKMPEGAVSISSHNTQVTMLGDNVAIITGYNNAIVNPPAMKEQTIYQVRQTFVVQKIRGKWLIVHEHASFFPLE